MHAAASICGKLSLIQLAENLERILEKDPRRAALAPVCADRCGISSGGCMEMCPAAKVQAFSAQVWRRFGNIYCCRTVAFPQNETVLILDADHPQSCWQCLDCSWTSGGGDHGFPCHTQLGVYHRVISLRQTCSSQDDGVGVVPAPVHAGSRNIFTH